MCGLLLLQLALVLSQFQHEVAHLPIQLIYLPVLVQNQVLQLADPRAQLSFTQRRRWHRGLLLRSFLFFEGGRRGSIVLELLMEVVREMCRSQFIILFLHPVVLLDDTVKILGLVFECVLIVLDHFGDFLSDSGREGECDLEGEAVLA